MKNILSLGGVALALLGALQSCEPEADRLGEQLFSPIHANADSMRVVAYNISNNDTIRSDAFTGRVGILGAFSEPVFGMQKANYVSQVRMAAYDFDFGTNAAVDSAVLVLRPSVVVDSATTSTDENFVFPLGNVASKKVVKTYPISKYGKANINGAPTQLTLQVQEVTDFLQSPATVYYSNQQVAVNPTPIGTAVVKGKAASVVITDKATNAELFKSDASIRIPLDKNFFQNKIIAKKGSSELKDVANFIRYFKGIRIAVQENDGYLMQFDPDNAQIIMYYKYDVVANNTTTRPQASFVFPLLGKDSGGNYYNTKIGQFEYNRTGSLLANEMSGNTTAGSTRLFMQGMGGPSAAIKVTAAQVQAMKDKFKNTNAAIIGARIRFYTDQTVWSNSYAKPSQLSLIHWPENRFLLDQQAYVSQLVSKYFTAYQLNKNPAYYDFNVTRTLKNVVENADPAKDLVLRLDVGDYLVSPAAGLVGAHYNTRSYMRERVVLVGSNTESPLAVKLQIVYSNQ